MCSQTVSPLEQQTVARRGSDRVATSPSAYALSSRKVTMDQTPLAIKYICIKPAWIS